MPDMFVNLLKLPPMEPVLAEMKAQGVIIRRAQPFDMNQVVDWVIKEFSRTWGDEVTVAYTRQPATLYLAIREGKLLGFGAYECTCRNFFGPTGVAKELRGQGIGKALLLACLHAMREMGYVYAIIGAVGPAEFYTKCVGATVIPDSTPGIFTDRIAKG